MIQSGFLHQVIRARPVAMTIQQRADDAAAQHSRKRFLISLWLERRNDFIAAREAANVQALFVRRAATKAGVVRRVGFLNALFGRVHMFLDFFPGAFAAWREIFSREGARAQSD